MPRSASKQERKKFTGTNLLTPIKHLLKSSQESVEIIKDEVQKKDLQKHQLY